MGATYYEQMTDRIMLTGSKVIPELFRMIVDAKEAELMLAMPGTPEELAGKTGRPLEEVSAACAELYHKGVAFKSFKTGTVSYKMCRDMLQFHDASILWPEAPRAFLDLWQRFMEEEWPNFARLAAQIFPKPFTRIIPVDQDIDGGKQQVLDLESATHMVKNAGTLAVTKCTCRLIAHKCDKPLEVCLQIDNAAKYSIDRGSGRKVTPEEALNILKTAEEAGLVRVTMNRAHAGHFICNCCSCCCQALPLMISEGLTICDPSRYQARIDETKCSGCGTCVDRCQFNAITASESDDSVMTVLTEKCMGCGICGTTCPEEAISLIEFRPVNFIPA